MASLKFTMAEVGLAFNTSSYKMLERILTGWNFQRALYVIFGMLAMVQSLSHKEWMGVVFGGYFAFMGLFALGCASGTCSTAKQKEAVTKEVEYEEIKPK